MKVLVLGVGGVGSYLAEYLVRFTPKDKYVEFTLADGDIVEPKNLLYSNFTKSEVGLNKAYALAQRLSVETGTKVKSVREFLKTPADIQDWAMGNLIIVATDDITSRQLVHREADFFIDVRAEDNLWQVYTSKSELAKVMTFGTSSPDTRGSCQRNPEKRVFMGHIKAASRGAELALMYLNDEVDKMPAHDLGFAARSVKA